MQCCPSHYIVWAYTVKFHVNICETNWIKTEKSLSLDIVSPEEIIQLSYGRNNILELFEVEQFISVQHLYSTQIQVRTHVLLAVDEPN